MVDYEVYDTLVEIYNDLLYTRGVKDTAPDPHKFLAAMRKFDAYLDTINPDPKPEEEEEEHEPTEEEIQLAIADMCYEAHKDDEE